MSFGSKFLSVAAGAVVGLGMMAAAQAAPVGGGPVDSSVFTAAGLGNGTGWTLVSIPEVFGGGSGNGAFVNGGTAEFELRVGSYGHKFGAADYSDHNPANVIFNTAVDSVGAVKSFTNPDGTGSFVFYFETVCSNCSSDDGRVYSDGDRDNDGYDQLDMAIYLKDGVYAFFFDDGGPDGTYECGYRGHDTCYNDDNDYNDMVVTLRATSVPEPMTLGLLGAGLAGLGFAARRRRQG